MAPSQCNQLIAVAVSGCGNAIDCIAGSLSSAPGGNVLESVNLPVMAGFPLQGAAGLGGTDEGFHVHPELLPLLTLRGG